MPKIITTRTNLVNLGKPIVIIGEGLGALEVVKGRSGLKPLMFCRY